MSHNPRKTQLETLCNQVEAVLARNHAPGFIGGGTHGPDRIQLEFTPDPHIRQATVLALLPVLSTALGRPVDGERGAGYVTLRLATPAARQQYALEVDNGQAH